MGVAPAEWLAPKAQVQLARLPAQTTRIFLRGQAVPTRSLNQKPHLSCQFWFSTPKVRPNPVFGPPKTKALPGALKPTEIDQEAWEVLLE